MTDLNIIEASKTVVSLLNDIDNYIDLLPNQLSECDCRLSDLYHFAEDNKMDTSQRYAFVTELQNVLKKRRRIKKDMSIGAVFKGETTKLNNKTNRTMFVTDISKRVKRLNTKYKNNIYTDEDFVNLKIKKEDKNVR